MIENYKQNARNRLNPGSAQILLNSFLEERSIIFDQVCKTEELLLAKDDGPRLSCLEALL